MNKSFKLALATTFILWAGSALAQDVVGVIKRAHGPAVIERAGVQSPATRGTQLRKGDRILTGEKGNVDITMRGAAMSVGPHAAVTLDHFASDPTQSAQNSVPPMLQGLASLLTLNRSR